jgi:hypothetical protein
MDEFDYIEDLALKCGARFDLFHGITLNSGGEVAAVVAQMTAENTAKMLIAHWREIGLPDYAQFDNGSVFLGRPSAFVVSRVARLCLSLGITPVFTVPGEPGWQAVIEAANGRWEDGVYFRQHYRSLVALERQSAAYIAAERRRKADKISDARRPFPETWDEDKFFTQPLSGQMIFLRRASGKNTVSFFGREWPLAEPWAHRPTRIEADFTRHEIRIFGLRRRAPETRLELGRIPLVFPPQKSRKKRKPDDKMRRKNCLRFR